MILMDLPNGRAYVAWTERDLRALLRIIEYAIALATDDRAAIRAAGLPLPGEPGADAWAEQCQLWYCALESCLFALRADDGSRGALQRMRAVPPHTVT